MARFRRGAFLGVNPWQVLRSMHPESGLGRENRQFAARFARHASENGLALARYARHASEMPRKPPSEDTPREDLARKGPFSLHGPLESRMARESCHPASTKRPSARNPGAAEQREPPELDRPAQETQPGGSAPVASWAASTASSSLGTATALCQHQPVACRPANNSVIADSVTCGDSIHAAPAPPIRRAALAQREGYLPYLWRLSSVFLADAIGL